MKITSVERIPVDAGFKPRPAVHMARELWNWSITEVIRLTTDSGRMETRQWAYFAPGVRRVRDAPQGDEELELSFVGPQELRRLIADGELVQAIHLGIVGAALVRGLL